MPKGIRIHTLGGPEVLRWEDIEVSPPSPGEVQIRHTAIGLNFIDIYHRTGIYPIPLPAIIGSEAVVYFSGQGHRVFGLALRRAWLRLRAAHLEGRRRGPQREPADRIQALQLRGPGEVAERSWLQRRSRLGRNA